MNAREIVHAPGGASSFTLQGLLLSAIRGAFRTLCVVAPPLAARVAERIWFSPGRMPLSANAKTRLATGERFELTVNGRQVVAWSWGQGPAVILMHGWGGRASQMLSFVEPLQRAGFRAVAFDCPSHGESEGPRQTTFFEFRDALLALSERVAPVHGLIAHSGGCTASGTAIRAGWSVPAVVYIAPMASPLLYQRMFQQALGITDGVLRRFVKRVEQRLQFRWEDLELTRLPAFVPTPPVLVVHDYDDPETSWSEGQSIAETWPDSELMSTRGLGHRKVLRDEAVIQRTVGFLVESAADRAVSA